MESFIEKTIKIICEKHTDFTNIVFVLPKKRPILFLKKELRNKINNGFLPKFITIQELMEELSNLSLIQNIPLWLKSYEIYKIKQPEQDLNDFLKWIPTVLADFNDLEIFTENPIQVIDYLISIERIENWGVTFGELENYDSALKNIDFWTKLKDFYINLQEYLLKNELATEGIITQKAKELVIKEQKKSDIFYYFIGFNAFSPSEEKIVKYLFETTQAELFFDTDEYYINDKKQEAGNFIRKYKNWNSYFGKDFNFIENHFNKPKNIKQYPAGNSIMQAKILGNILKNIPKEEFNETAIILCDEKLLLPILESIPEYIEHLNITMGFPISQTSHSLFFIKILNLRTKLEKKSINGFYITDLIEILQSSIIPKNLTDLTQECILEIKNKNWFFITQNYLETYFENTSLAFIFKKYDNSKLILEEFINFLTILIEQEKSKNSIISKVLLGMINLFSSVSKLVDETSFITNFESLQLIFKQLILSEKLSFVGEPLHGIQLMGLLESRLLSFKNVILLSVNEGIIPLGRIENSFIPFDVKKKYDINTFVENDSIYAYHFYRLIQQSQNISFIFEDDPESSKERSRFLLQLELESNHKIETINFAYSHKTNLKEPIIIKKDEFILNKLNNWFERGISPSSLSYYLYNPFDFYLKYILEINQEQEIEEEINIQKLGILIHGVLENSYKKFIDKKLEITDFIEIKNGINPLIKEQIKKEQIQQIDSGINFLHLEIARKSIERIISFDENLVKTGNSLIILKLEEKFEIDYEIQNLGKTKFKGIIDRIDSLNGQIRIIDYKTTAQKSGYNININKDNFELTENHKHQIQLAIYCFYALYKLEITEIQSGIWGFNLPSKGVQFLSLEKEFTLNKQNIHDLMLHINLLIQSIMNQEIHFEEQNKGRF